MSLRLCAWHPRYRGYPRLLGFTRWCGALVTHGICPGCLARTLGSQADVMGPEPTDKGETHGA